MLLHVVLAALSYSSCTFNSDCDEGKVCVKVPNEGSSFCAEPTRSNDCDENSELPYDSQFGQNCATLTGNESACEAAPECQSVFADGVAASVNGGAFARCAANDIWTPTYPTSESDDGGDDTGYDAGYTSVSVKGWCSSSHHFLTAANDTDCWAVCSKESNNYKYSEYNAGECYCSESCTVDKEDCTTGWYTILTNQNPETINTNACDSDDGGGNDNAPYGYDGDDGDDDDDMYNDTTDDATGDAGYTKVNLNGFCISDGTFTAENDTDCWAVCRDISNNYRYSEHDSGNCYCSESCTVTTESCNTGPFTILTNHPNDIDTSACDSDGDDGGDNDYYPYGGDGDDGDDGDETDDIYADDNNSNDAGGDDVYTDDATGDDNTDGCTDDKTPLIFVITTDEYPDETRWTLAESPGENILHAWGPFDSENTNISNFCLDDGCYTLVIEDEYGDGFKGQYTLTFAQGGTTILSNGNTVNLSWQNRFYGFCLDKTSPTKFNTSEPVVVSSTSTTSTTSTTSSAVSCAGGQQMFTATFVGGITDEPWTITIGDTTEELSEGEIKFCGPSDTDYNGDITLEAPGGLYTSLGLYESEYNVYKGSVVVKDESGSTVKVSTHNHRAPISKALFQSLGGEGVRPNIYNTTAYCTKANAFQEITTSISSGLDCWTACGYAGYEPRGLVAEYDSGTCTCFNTCTQFECFKGDSPFETVTLGDLPKCGPQIVEFSGYAHNAQWDGNNVWWDILYNSGDHYSGESYNYCEVRNNSYYCTDDFGRRLAYEHSLTNTHLATGNDEGNSSSTYPAEYDKMPWQDYCSIYANKTIAEGDTKFCGVKDIDPTECNTYGLGDEMSCIDALEILSLIHI